MFHQSIRQNGEGEEMKIRGGRERERVRAGENSSRPIFSVDRTQPAPAFALISVFFVSVRRFRNVK